MDVMLLTLTVISLASAITCGMLALQAKQGERRRAEARVAALSAAIDGRAASGAGASAMFTPQRHVAAHGNPLIKAVVGVAMTVALVVGLAMATRDSPASASRGSDETGPSAAASMRPLELVSMRQAREGDTLEVTGLVRNPRGGSDLDHVTAVVLAFAGGGSFVASGRAPLDLTTLRPGDESAFVVSIPNASGVERYRVTFRTDRGIVRHLDFRNR